MCIICVSPEGVPQPSVQALKTMFSNNPDGAGYMVARNNRVEIHKAFMNFADYIRSIESEHFTDSDPVIYHCRICTQAKTPDMSHPFPITTNNIALKAWDLYADIGVAHNGIIKLTANGNPEYSDTALYIKNYLSHYIQSSYSLTPSILHHIEEEAGGKLAFLDKYGNTFLTGEWEYDNGLFYSNHSYRSDYFTYHYVNYDDFAINWEY